MANMEPNKNPTEQAAKAQSQSDNAAKLHAQIKAKWNKLSDDDIKLASSNRDQFIAKLKEKQNLSKEDAEKHLAELEKSCGCGTGAAKAA